MGEHKRHRQQLENWVKLNPVHQIEMVQEVRNYHIAQPFPSLNHYPGNLVHNLYKAISQVLATYYFLYFTVKTKRAQ